MKEKNIVLVTPAPISHRTAEENLGIGYLASILRSKGKKVVIIDGWLEGLKTHQIVDRILEIDNILCIGFSCYRSNMNKATEICQTLKKKKINVPFIAGGYGPTFYWEDFLIAGFDYVVRGEAEETIIELTDFLLSNSKKVSEILGICYLENDQIKCNATRPLIEDIDTIPFPSRDSVEFAVKRKSLVNIISSRGCNANCIFCSIIAFQKISKGKRWRQRSIKNFVDELELLNKQGIKFFKVIDDSFIEPPRDVKWCQNLADEILKRNLDVRLRGSIRADRVSDDIIFNLKRAGFFSFSCGIENGSKSALRRMGKPATVDQNKKALEIFEKHEIYVQAGFILFDPFTTLVELEENYGFMLEHQKLISKGIFTEMYAAEGTPFNRLLQNRKLVTKEFSNHGNAVYKIQDSKTSISYGMLKTWHKAHSEIYDMTIDPISAPKALEDNGLVLFHSLFMELRLKDLNFLRKILDYVKGNDATLEEGLDLTNEEILLLKEWYQSFKLKLYRAYSKFGLIYDAEVNPFIC